MRSISVRYLGCCLLIAALLLACKGASALGEPTSEPGPDLPVASPTEVTPSPAALPEERIQVKVATGSQSYPVFGDTPEEIFAYIDVYGPVDDKGQRSSGVTIYKARLEWVPQREPRSCSVGSMTIHVDLGVTLPLLDASSRLPAAQRPGWDGFAEDVRAHEQRHVDIYLDGVETMKERMLAIKPASSCTQLESTVNDTWDSQQRLIDDEQEQFHEEERKRIESARAPLKTQIDSNRSRLDDVLARIDGIESSLTTLSAQIDPLKAALDDLTARLKAIEDSAPTATVPTDLYQQYEAIITQYNNLLPSYNSLINQYNAQTAQYQKLANEAETLRIQTNQLVEQYNWAR